MSAFLEFYGRQIKKVFGPGSKIYLRYYRFFLRDRRRPK